MWKDGDYSRGCRMWIYIIFPFVIYPFRVDFKGFFKKCQEKLNKIMDSTEHFTTKTASLKATKIKTNNITLKGKNIMDYIPSIHDERGNNITENDLWGTKIISEDNQVSVINDWVTNPNGDDMSAWNTSITEVSNNKAYIGDSFYANIQTDKIKNGSYLFNDCQNFVTFSSDLDTMTNGEMTFAFTSLANLDTSLTSLVNGYGTFFETKMTAFNLEMPSLVNAWWMFGDSKLLKSFFSKLPSLNNGECMFCGCTELSTFDSDLSSLIDGNNMFCYCSLLENFDSDLSSLTEGSYMFYESGLKKFDVSLHSLRNAEAMFTDCFSLKKVDGDFTSLESAWWMFGGCSEMTSFKGNLSKLENGNQMFVGCENLIEFSEDLSSLKYGAGMFESCYRLEKFTSDLSSLLTGCGMFNSANLNVESFEYIADGIKNLVESGHSTINEDGTITFNEDESMWEYTNYDSESGDRIVSVVEPECRGKIELWYNLNLSEKEIQNIEEICQEIRDKGWIVYLNEESHVSRTRSTRLKPFNPRLAKKPVRK